MYGCRAEFQEYGESPALVLIALLCLCVSAGEGSGGQMAEVRRKSEYPMLDVDDALEIVHREVGKMCRTEEEVPSELARDRIVWSDVLADEDRPPFRASVMDGYAVIASQGTGEFVVSGEVTAGKRPDVEVGGDKVAYVTTGAPVPDGADAVVPVEVTTAREGGKIKIQKAAKGPGHFVRKIGADIERGAVILSKHERIGVAEVGLLATCNKDKVLVYKRPVVSVLSTGDEIMPCGSELGFGQIIDSNRPMLLSAIDACGGKGLDLGIARDTEEDVMNAFTRAMKESDVLITSGGVSMGNKDMIKPILERIGTVHIGRLMMKPGKPLTFATVESGELGEGVPETRKVVVGLPGNPISSFVCFHLFVAPIIRALSGSQHPSASTVSAITTMPLKLDPERPEYHRAIIKWNPECNAFTATSTGLQASSRLLSARSANALLLLPRSEETLPVGSTVRAMVIGDI